MVFQYHLSKRYSPLIHLWSLTIRLCRGLGDKRSTLWGIIVSIVLQSIKEKRKWPFNQIILIKHFKILFYQLHSYLAVQFLIFRLIWVEKMINSTLILAPAPRRSKHLNKEEEEKKKEVIEVFILELY